MEATVIGLNPLSGASTFEIHLWNDEAFHDMMFDESHHRQEEQEAA
jgi:hypothetical protein